MSDKNFVKILLTIKDYKSTLNTFIEESKSDKPKKKSRYFVDCVQSAIQSNDIELVTRVWRDYEVSYFKYLDYDKQKAADCIKSDIFKAFLVECFKNKKTDKINSFYNKMGIYILSNKQEWSDWLEFPFVKIPSEHKVFGIYFTRLWSESFYLSMFNFFMQVVRSVTSVDSELEKFFAFDTYLEKCLNDCSTTEIETTKQKFNLANITTDKIHISDQIVSNFNYPSRNLNEAAELCCDFRLVRENKQIEYRKLSRSNKPKGISQILQNKPKQTSPTTFIRKKPLLTSVESLESRENCPKIEVKEVTEKTEKPMAPSAIILDPDQQVIIIEDSNNQVDSDPTNSINVVPSEISRSAPFESFGIKLLSNKISQKIFRPKVSVNNEYPKSIIHHEHFSMVTHVKFSRMAVPYWASLDAGGTFKVWSTNELSPKSLHTLSFKHTIYSFDWVSCNSDLILLGTKGGSIKLFNMTNKEIVHTMIIDSSFPRINIVQSFDHEAKFVCESLDRSRATISNNSLPQGVISLYDTETWSSIRPNLMTLNADFTVNCLTCTSNSIAAGCSNGSLQLIDVRDPCHALFGPLQIFDGDEVVNVTNMCQSKWLKSHMDSNYLFCLSSKSLLKMFDIRNISKSLPKESFQLTDLNMPFSWAERPYGGEQTIYFPRANLISAAYLNNNILFSAARKGILMQKISGSSLSDSMHLNTAHNSPVICIDSSPGDLNDPHTGIVISGTMEGTISTIKVNNINNSIF